MILVAIISGVVIDSFQNIHTKRVFQKENLQNQCLICGLVRADLQRDVSFVSHVERHSMERMFNLLIHLRMTLDFEKHEPDAKHVWFGFYNLRILRDLEWHIQSLNSKFIPSCSLYSQGISSEKPMNVRITPEIESLAEQKWYEVENWSLDDVTIDDIYDDGKTLQQEIKDSIDIVQLRNFNLQKTMRDLKLKVNSLWELSSVLEGLTDKKSRYPRQNSVFSSDMV